MRYLKIKKLTSKVITISAGFVAMTLVAVASAQPQVNVLDVNIDPVERFPTINANVSINTTAAAECDLTEDNFAIEENGIPQTITSLECTSGGTLAADIVVLFDDTGSMFQEIETMKASASSFVSNINDAGIDARFALVTFKDEPRTVTDFTTDVGEFQEAADALRAVGGGDTPEASVDAVFHAFETLNFRDDSLKVYLVITDAPAHFRGDGSLYSSFLINEVIPIINDQGGTVYAVSRDFSSARSLRTNSGKKQELTAETRGNILDPQRDIRLFAEETGGRWLDIESSTDFSVLLDSVVASLQAIYTVQYESNNESPSTDREVCISVTDPVAGTNSDCASYQAPALNDDFANRTFLQNTQDFNSLQTTLRSATKEPVEPDHGGDPGGSSLWYEWVADKDARYIFHTMQVSQVDTLLAVYRGNELPNLQLVGESDNAPELASTDIDKSAVVFDAKKGDRFVIALDAKSGTAGNVTLWYYDLTWDNFETAGQLTGERPAIQYINVGGTRQDGEPTINGIETEHSFWFRWTAPYSGPTEFNLTNNRIAPPFNVIAGIGAIYTGTDLDNLQQVATTNNGKTNFTTEFGQEYYFQVDAFNGEFVVGNLKVGPKPPNDDFSQSVQLSGETGTYTGSNRGGNSELGEPDHAGVDANISVWHEYQSRNDSGWLSFNVFTESQQARLATYEGRSLTTLREEAATLADPQSLFEDFAVYMPLTETTYQVAYDSDSPGGNYEMSWRIRPDLEEDAFEENDDFASAVDLLRASEEDLEQLVAADEDYFRIDVPPSQSFRSAIFLNDDQGDLDLLLYRQLPSDLAPVLIQSSVSDSNFEQVVYDNRSGGPVKLFLRVTGQENRFYSLRYQLRPVNMPVEKVLLTGENGNLGLDSNGDGIIDVADIIRFNQQ